MRLRVRTFGMAGGIVLGLTYAIMIILSLIFGLGQTIGVMKIVVPFFDRSLWGAGYGLLSGFIEGFLVGAFFAWSYNKLNRMFYGPGEAT
jgi:hypothetical protein